MILHDYDHKLVYRIRCNYYSRNYPANILVQTVIWDRMYRAGNEIAHYFLQRFSSLLRLYTEEVHWIGTRISLPRFTSDNILRLLDAVEPALAADCCAVMDLPLPAWVIGDLHGNFHDLLRVFTTTGAVPANPILFLGDYVDRGSYSIEVVLLLFALKAAYPDRYYFLRGNHEFPHVNEQYGFKEECDLRYPHTGIWERVNQLFTVLPLAAILGGSVVCLHGGIGPDCHSIDHLRAIPVPIEDESPVGIVSQIVWSDPAEGVNGFAESARGCGYTFGDTELVDFLRESRCKKLLRAHECVMHGLQPFGNRMGLTVFTTSNYGHRKNAAGFILIAGPRQIKTYQLAPLLDIVERDSADYQAVIAFEEETVPSPLIPDGGAEPTLKGQSYPISKLPKMIAATRSVGLLPKTRAPDPRPARRQTLRTIAGATGRVSAVVSLPMFPVLAIDGPE
jgi:hypothetical protein